MTNTNKNTIQLPNPGNDRNEQKPTTAPRIAPMFAALRAPLGTLFAFLLALLCSTLTGLPETGDWPENFDDGNGDDRWYADNGVWQMGVPSSGPGAAHSRSNCAATVLNGNYPVGANSRLIRISSFTVPAASQFPRLRFWHWYTFASSGVSGYGSDYGVVEVKGTNGTWQEVSPRYTGNGGGWTDASVDLSIYAGQTVQMAFHMVFGQTPVNGGNFNTSPGWYIDDVGLVTGIPVLNNPEGFENGIGDWYAESGIWQVGVPTSGPGSAHTGTNCAATVLNGNYPGPAFSYGPGPNSRLVSPAFQVPAASQFPRLRFSHWYIFASSGVSGYGNDHGVVEVKGTNGTWQVVSPGYYGNGGGWTDAAVDLSAYAGQTVQVAFHMVFGQTPVNGGNFNTSPGWYLDDVALVNGRPVLNNPEGFENGIGDWYAESGIWQVGVPTSPNSYNFNGLAGFGWTFGRNAGIDHNSGTWYSAGAPGGSQAAFIQGAYPGSCIAQTLNFPATGSYSITFACIGRGGSYGPSTIQVQMDGNAAYTVNYASQSQTVWQTNTATYNCTAAGVHTLSFVGVRTGGDYSSCIDNVSVTGSASVTVANPSFETPQISGYAGQAGSLSGSSCAATILNGNYPGPAFSYGPGPNSRLVSPAFQVPAANQFPRMRFWHWYTFASSGVSGYGNDYGIVEVKGTNGTWQAVSPGYYGNGGGWTGTAVDLSVYAGQTVQVAFHMVFGQTPVNGGNFNTSPGWYIDDVALVTGTPSFNNPEGFENGIGDWYAESGTWQVGVPGPPALAHTGNNCAATVLNGNYPAPAFSYGPGPNSRLVSPLFVVPPASASPNLRFWSWYCFACSGVSGHGCDYGVVEIRPVGANNWTPISAQYSGCPGGWTRPLSDLTSYGGQTVQVAFHMVFGQTPVNGGNFNTADGWYVDEVAIVSSGAPIIITAPASQTNSVGSSATLNVSASGGLPLSYQWRFNSNAIVGATNTSLTLSNLQLTDTGYYDVVVTNSWGSITSTPAALLQVVISFVGVDIGNTNAPGGFTQSNGVYTVTGSGEDIVGTADAFYYVQQPLNGDCQIVARVTSLAGPDLAEAGIMIRESLANGSKHASLLVNAKTNVAFRRRLTTDAYSVQTRRSPTNHVWFRLMRMGNNFVGLCSTNGMNWEYLWFTTINMSNQVQVGLAVTAHQNESYATATMDNVSIGSLTPLPTWPLSGPMLLTGGEPWVESEFQRVGGFRFLLGGVVGDYCNITASTNLGSPSASWSTLATVTNTYGVLPILDPTALTNKMKYYRAQRIGP